VDSDQESASQFPGITHECGNVHKRMYREPHSYLLSGGERE
jgi:hypothetical protein